MTGCVLEHILGSSSLSSLEKLFYLLSTSLALINSQNNKQMSCSLASSSWAKMLDCSRSQIFLMQKSLEEKGYLLIKKDKNSDGQNKRNLLTPTLPDAVFDILRNAQNRVGKGDEPYVNTSSTGFTLESKLGYLSRTKLFIPLNYNILKIISSSIDLTPIYKVTWLDFYTKCYKNHIAANKKSDFAFITSYKELMDNYGCSRNSLSKIMNFLENNGFITKNRYFLKKDKNSSLEDRADKSIWQITLSLPNSYNLELENIKDRAGINRESIFIPDNEINQPERIYKELENNDFIDQESYLENEEEYIDNILDALDELSAINKNLDDDICSISNVSMSETLKDPKVSSVGSFSDSNDSALSSVVQSNAASPDPHIAKSSLYKKKYSKLNLKEIKSNLEATPKVLFGFLERKNKIRKNKTKSTEFNIISSLIRNKLKILPREKADKARKFAYSLFSQSLAKGYAATLSKHELAKQFIYHAATWKPTKLGSISFSNEIDVSLAIAWKRVADGTWKAPLALVKAGILQNEYQYHLIKYQKFGTLSPELRNLEIDVKKLLGGYLNLTYEITSAPNNSKELSFSSLETENTNLHHNLYENSTNSNKIGANNLDNFNESGCRMSKKATLEFTHDLSNLPSAELKAKYENGFDFGFELELEKITVHEKDFTNLPEHERHLKVTTDRASDLMSMKTIEGNEYYFNLNSMEVNSDGDFVMILKPTELKLFPTKELEGIEFEKIMIDRPVI